MDEKLYEWKNQFRRQVLDAAAVGVWKKTNLSVDEIIAAYNPRDHILAYYFDLLVVLWRVEAETLFHKKNYHTLNF
jgi:hypothetical protein